MPVSIIRASVPVQYRIKDVCGYLYNYADSRAVLESICYREIVNFTASSIIETDGGENSVQSILGAGRMAGSEYLKEKIQQKADDAGLGVEIVFLSLQGVHPPPDVAEDYQQVIGAVQKRQAAVLGASADKDKVLSGLVGSVGQADELYQLVGEYQRAKHRQDEAAVAELTAKLDEAFTAAKGEVFAELSVAKSYAFEKQQVARATGLRFADQIKAYRASEDIYTQQLRLSMLEEALADTRKFIVAADTNDTQVYIIDLQEKLTPGLYDILEEK